MSKSRDSELVPARHRAIDALDSGDREWLAARLKNYRALQYLAEH